MKRKSIETKFIKKNTTTHRYKTKKQEQTTQCCKNNRLKLVPPPSHEAGREGPSRTGISRAESQSENILQAGKTISNCISEKCVERSLTPTCIKKKNKHTYTERDTKVSLPRGKTIEKYTHTHRCEDEEEINPCKTFYFQTIKSNNTYG